MTLDKMVRINLPATLQSIYHQLLETQSKYMLWQYHETIQRRICSFVRLGQLNLSNRELTLYPVKGDFKFSPHQYLYFLGYRRTTIFKASILYHSPLKIIIRLPEEIMMANSRNMERQDLLEEWSTIEYCHNPSFNPNLEQIYHHSKLTDLSQGGLSFRISLTNIIKFKKGDHIWFRSPQHKDHLLMEGEVRHVTQVLDPHTHERFMKVGVQIFG